jgi:hypothetical protein
MSTEPNNAENYNAAVVNNMAPMFEYGEVLQHIEKLYKKPEDSGLNAELVNWLRQLEKFLVKMKDVEKLETVLEFREDLEDPVRGLKVTLSKYGKVIRSWDNAQKQIQLVKGKIGGTRHGRRHSRKRKATRRSVRT